MCRPSCCKPPDEGAGIAAAAVIAAVFAAAKIGPAVARIWHTAVEAVTIFALTCAAAVVVVLATWAVTRIIIGSRRAHRQELPHPVWPAPRHHAAPAGSEAGCLACGGTGTVLRAITANRYQADPCPVCDPAERAG